MTAFQEFQISSEVVSRQVGVETMLLDLRSGLYFGLDPVGGRYWQLVEEGKSWTEARNALLTEYDVEPDVLDSDLAELHRQLVERDLIKQAC